MTEMHNIYPWLYAQFIFLPQISPSCFFFYIQTKPITMKIAFFLHFFACIWSAYFILLLFLLSLSFLLFVKSSVCCPTSERPQIIKHIFVSSSIIFVQAVVLAIVVTGEDAEAVAVLAAVTVEASVAVAAGTKPAYHDTPDPATSDGRLKQETPDSSRSKKICLKPCVYPWECLKIICHQFV